MPSILFALLETALCEIKPEIIDTSIPGKTKPFSFILNIGTLAWLSLVEGLHPSNIQAKIRVLQYVISFQL